MNISRNSNIYQYLIINKYIKTARSDTDRTATLSLVVWKTHLTIICVKWEDFNVMMLSSERFHTMIIMVYHLND